MQAIAQAGFDFRDVDAILYSHLHVDHTSDMAPFLFASRLPENPRTKDLSIIGPPGTGLLLGGFKDLYEPWLEPQRWNCGHPSLPIARIWLGFAPVFD